MVGDLAREVGEVEVARQRRQQREGQRCEAGSSRSLSDGDRGTFAPELWNCLVWNWNGGASGAVICNKFQLLQHFKWSSPTIMLPLFLLWNLFVKVTSTHLRSLIFFVSFFIFFNFFPLPLITQTFFCAYVLSSLIYFSLSHHLCTAGIPQACWASCPGLTVDVQTWLFHHRPSSSSSRLPASH